MALWTMLFSLPTNAAKYWYLALDSVIFYHLEIINVLIDNNRIKNNLLSLTTEQFDGCVANNVLSFLRPSFYTKKNSAA